MDIDEDKTTIEHILVSVPEYMRKVKCDTDKDTLPFKCAVVSCTNKFFSFEERDKYPYKFHNFPENVELCQKWKARCGLEGNACVRTLKVCSDHFELDDYIRNYKAEFTNPNFKRELKPNSVPNKNISSSVKVIAKDDDLNFDEVKEVTDEYEILNQRYSALLAKKSGLEEQLAAMNKKISNKRNEICRRRNRLQDNTKKMMEFKDQKNVLRKIFSEAQVNLLMGKERVFWSEDDLAMAFTLRHMGTKECYLYLKNTLNMPLPALACVQKWAASGGPPV